MITYGTRDAFPAAKIHKEGSPRAFNKHTKSHFSNFEDGRSPDQENARQCFLCQCFFKLKRSLSNFFIHGKENVI